MSTTAERSTRRDFVTAIRERFDEAGIEYAFLHDMEGSERDSDVDVVANHEHLPAIEAVARTGALGRLVQRMDYDVPWCRYYVFATGDRERPFRQLDVASDPYGISRYGLGVSRALAGARRVDGAPVLRPASSVVYLATKRARKGIRHAVDEERLGRAFAEDPLGAEHLLSGAWGDAGAGVANALAARSGLGEVLALLDEALARSRRTPRRLTLRAVFEARRRLDRWRRPTGLVLQLVGPDGAGKSTLAASLERCLTGAFRRTSLLHLGPGLLPAPARLLGRSSGDFSAPHGRAPNGRVGSYIRIAYLWTDALVGWLPRLWAPRARSTLVVLERGWDDLRIDPLRYRLGAGRGLVRVLSRLLPNADLTLLASGEPTAIVSRKPELGEPEVARQLAAWRGIMAARAGAEVDTTQPDAAERATATVVQHLSARAGNLDEFGVALECLGGPHARGRPFSVVPAAGAPRWLLPRGRGAPGPLATRLYRPASLTHLLGASAVGIAQRLGGVGLEPVALDPRVGLAPEIGAALGGRHVALACLLPTDRLRRDRATLSVLRNGRPVAIAKVAAGRSPELERERLVLEAIGSVGLEAIVAPTVLAAFRWRRYDVLVTSLVPTRGRTDRDLGAHERRALLELVRATPAVQAVLGPSDGRVLVHGDFSAWNTARHGRDRLALWDWEWARYGLALEDYFHWQTQRLVHFDRASAGTLVTSATDPDADLRRLCIEGGFDPRCAPRALEASLRAGLATASPGRAHDLRAEALRLLGGAA